VRAVSEIEIFMSQHWSTMVTVYIIGAAVTFVLTFVIFWMLERQSEKEEREKELFPEYYEEQDRIMVKLTFFILSVLVAVIWIGVPFILAFIFIMSVIDDSGDKKQKEEKK
jgi:Na+/melibiose symporter-like transporter